MFLSWGRFIRNKWCLGLDFGPKFAHPSQQFTVERNQGLQPAGERSKLHTTTARWEGHGGGKKWSAVSGIVQEWKTCKFECFPSPLRLEVLVAAFALLRISPLWLPSSFCQQIHEGHPREGHTPCQGFDCCVAPQPSAEHAEWRLCACGWLTSLEGGGYEKRCGEGGKSERQTAFRNGKPSRHLLHPCCAAAQRRGPRCAAARC